MSPLKVHIAETEDRFLQCAHQIINRKPTVLGFDTETALSHANTSVSLIQIYDGHECYLFRINMVQSYPKAFLKLMTRKYIKVGFDVEMDCHKLRKYCQLEVFGVLDLQHLIKTLDYPFTSMKDGVKHFLGYDMKKGVNHDSWDDPVLDNSGIQYAALDAYLGYECYFKIIQAKPHQHLESEDYLNDRDDVLVVLRQSQTVDSLKLSSAQNVIANSFGKWRHAYSEPKRKEYALNVFYKLAEENKVSIIGQNLNFGPDRGQQTLTLPKLKGTQVPPQSSNIQVPSQSFDLQINRLASQKPSNQSALNQPKTTGGLVRVNPSSTMKDVPPDLFSHLKSRVFVSNMKLKSLANILTNSYPLIRGNPDGFQIAYEWIQQLVSQGVILQNTDGSYNLMY